MTNQSASENGGDLINTLIGVTSGGSTDALRRLREKVSAATQGSYDTLFNPDLPGLTLAERLLVALYACRLTPAPELAQHYLSRVAGQRVDSAVLEAVEHGQPESLTDQRQRAKLRITRSHTQKPIEGNQAVLQTLPAAGLSTPAVVTLSQLIAFISYQTRLLAGLKAIQSQELAA
jgi:uncharacterized protein YciW